MSRLFSVVGLGAATISMTIAAASYSESYEPGWLSAFLGWLVVTLFWARECMED